MRNISTSGQAQYKRSNPSQSSSKRSLKKKLLEANPSDLVNLGVDESLCFTQDLRELDELA
jgi:hypothetical protein